ncbi:MAG: putative quinol monooxygenase [Stagnimonas sp.]|nr:putative quinol monooxygenase [Stagnimonas sp.]
MSATNIAFLRARKGREQGLSQALHRLAEFSRDNPDCALSHLHRSEEDPALWFLYETWGSRAAMWEHLGTAPVQALVRQIGPWLESDLGLRSFHLMPGPPLELVA